MTRWNGGARASPRFDLGIRSICPRWVPVQPAHPGGRSRPSAAGDLGRAAAALTPPRLQVSLEVHRGVLPGEMRAAVPRALDAVEPAVLAGQRICMFRW